MGWFGTSSQIAWEHVLLWFSSWVYQLLLICIKDQKYINSVINYYFWLKNPNSNKFFVATKIEAFCIL